MKANLYFIEDLFHRSRALDPADRASFLDAECGSDLDLRAEVESLLANADHPSTCMSLRRRHDGNGSTTKLHDRGPLLEGPGTRIGPYKILQKIGEGGFGAVYMAEQMEPVQRKVALKIIKLGMDTKQVIARFEAERQALAMMDHPNIAKVLEAGATETGRPYFVMELVKGIPLMEYCDQNKLSMTERLDLFMQVCRAVQHAHQKGIIHRDIKPSNVLVTLHDTRPVPKVIDFGIAKATSRRLTEKTLFTEYHHFIGTPEYMSPDQAELSGLDVDTRTDIYSLGVVLYELLTGTTPLDPFKLRKAGYSEMQRIIREVEPPKPSTRVVTLAAPRGTDIARDRSTEPRTLSRLMRGDLDWIVMKAMEKDRTRRYQSASEFAADVDRYLRSQPVSAGPPRVSYKLAKFVRRHRLGVTAACLIIAALVVGISTATAGFVEARQQAHRSQRIADFLQELLVSTNPEQAITEDADVRTVLATARDVFGDDHATVAATLSSAALQLQSSGDLESAEMLYRQSLRIWREQFGDDDINVGTTLNRLGLLLLTKGDDAAAEQAFRESLRITAAVSGNETLAASDTMAQLAGVVSNRAEYEEAESLLRESLRVRRAVAPHQRLQIALTINGLANIMMMAGRDEASRPIIAETLAAWREALPAENTFLARVITDIGVWYLQHGDTDEAESLLREALDIFHRSDEPATRSRAIAVRVLSDMLAERDVPAESIPLAIEAVELAHVVEGGNRLPEVVQELGTMTWDVARESDRPASDYEIALEGIEAALAERPESAAYINTLGVLLYRLGDDEGAIDALSRSDAFYREQYETGVPADLAFMAMAHHRLGHDREAYETLDQLRQAMEVPELACTADNKRHLAEAEAALAEPGSKS